MFILIALHVRKAGVQKFMNGDLKEELLNEAQKQNVLRMSKEGGFTEEEALKSLKALREADMLNRIGFPESMQYLLK